LSDGKIDAEEAEDILNELASDGEVTAEEVQNLADALSEDGKLTNAEKELVADALVESIAPGESLTKEQIQDAGIEYKDLPADTPVEVRQDENGNEVVITAEVAAQVELLQNPAALVEELFTNPAAALAAFGSIGADMSDEEREEATDMVVATVVAAGAAINAAGVAAAGSTGGGTGGGGSSGGGSGANSPGSRGGRKW
jgi:polyhydroxyalkanoate synthesis regulator phasin